MYVKHAAALGESDRLMPAILAQIDPQAFWSAVLWLKPFIETLNELNLAQDLIDAWKALEAGKVKSKEKLTKCILAFGFLESDLKGPEENWGIKSSQDVHLRIAIDYAIGAVEAIHQSILEHKPDGELEDIRLHTLDYYVGTELDNYIMGRHKFFEMARQEGPNISDERIAHLLDKAMKAAGFSRDSKYRLQDPEKVCDNCGKRSKKKLMTCARCEGVSYCNAKCQKEHWKQHRGTCSRVFVQCQKQMAKLNINKQEPNIVPDINKGDGLLPPGPSMISEVSGTGNIGIFWNPDGESFINLLPASTLSGLANNLAEPQAFQSMANPEALTQNMQKFSSFSDLHPTQRFLLCCGPLPDLETAQQCCSEAIHLCEGRVDELRVPMVGFTALEWAAKKGNMEIVKWLCTDERTKVLIKHGCPVGWAGYTGRVEIMRYLVSKGVDPAKTDPILWSNQPPLLVAASNGQFEACKFLVEECNIDVKMKDLHGNDIIKSIKSAPNWRDLPGHVACHKWAMTLLK